MKLAFLITAWLVHVQVLCSTELFHKAEAELQKKCCCRLKVLSRHHCIGRDEALKQDSPLTIQVCERSFELLSELLEMNSLQLGLVPIVVYRLRSVKPVSKLCYPAIRTLFLDVSKETYAVCITAETASDPAMMSVGYYKEPFWTPFYEQYVNNPENVAAFYFNNHIYVLVADSGISSGTQLIKINVQTLFHEVDHLVHSNYATNIAVWSMKMDGKYHLAIANTNGNAANLSSEVSFYEWRETYFDEYSTFQAFDVKDIEPFHINDAAYIAIANFKRSNNNNRVDSEILRYDLDGKKWVSHQKIRTYGAMDWEFFSLGDSLGQEFFLALANNGDGHKSGRSIIYKFVLDKFVPFQCLQTTRATSIASFSNSGEFILAIANEDAVNLYQYDGWRFVMSGVQMTGGSMSDGVKHLVFHKVTLGSLILSVSNPRHALPPSVFKIEFVPENLAYDWNIQSTDWCSKTLSELESTDLDKTIGSLEDFILIDQPSVTINGDVVFEKGFEAGTLYTPKECLRHQLTSIITKEVFDSSLLNKLADLQGRLEKIRQKLDGFSVVLDNSLKTEGNQTITNSLEFQDVEFKCTNNSCHFENIYTSVLNQEHISDWKNKLIFLDSEQVINADLKAREINASSIHVSGLIDGIDSRTLVSKSGNHSIESDKTFNSISATDVVVHGKVDGVVISSADVLVTTGHQILHEEITFEDVTTTWLNATYVNGRYLSKFFNDLVLTDKSYSVTGYKTFKNVTIKELTMSPGSAINGVDISDLWSNALWINGRQEINGAITFSDAVFKNLKITGEINGIQIPGERVVDITETSIITAPQSFENSTKFGHLEVLDALNRMPLVQAPDGSKQLDIMLKTGDQRVTGFKTFHTIHLGGDSSVGGTVDGVDLSEFKTSVLRKDSTVLSNGTWVFKNVVFKNRLAVEGTVSGFKLEDVYRRALKLNESVIPDMTFKELVHVINLESNDINGINVQTDLVWKNKPQQLKGRYKFNEIVIQENADINGLINGKNFNFLKEILLKIGSQEIKSKTFKRDVKMGNLTVTKSINGIPITDIVTLKGGRIAGFRELRNVTFSDIVAKNVEVTGTVNGMDLKEMIEDTMTYYGNETVTGEKSIEGTVYILNGSNLEVLKSLNGLDIKKLWEDAVFVDIPQDITGIKTFQNDANFANLSFSGKLNGVSKYDMYNWMLKDVPQIVKSEVVFKNGFGAKNLQATTVNDLNLKNLESEIVKVNEDAEINGTVIFENLVYSGGDIDLTGRIQDINLSEEAVSRDEIIVTGEKTFSEDLVIKKDLIVDGLVDGIDVEDICSNTFLRNKDVNIIRLVIKGNVILTAGAISGSLAGVDLSLFNDIILGNGPEIKFDGVKAFANLTLAGPVTLKGKFGKVYLDHLNKNYMSLTRDQEIPATMEFDDLYFRGDLSVMNVDTDTNEINGLNLPELSGRILKTGGTQDITATYHIDEVYFESDIYVGGNVNGIKLPTGLMRRNHTNYINSEKIFEEMVTIEENLEIKDGQNVQDVDISEWFRKSVLKDGKFNVYGHKTFNKIDLYDVKLEGELDGLNISGENLLMTYGDQVVTGRKHIEGDVVIEGSLVVDGLINTVDLTRLSAETLQRDRNNTVTGVKYFEQPLTITNLEAPTVAGIDIMSLKDKLNTSLNLDRLEKHLEEMEGIISRMQTAFDSQAVLFQYYELFDKFDTCSVYDWLYVSGQDCGELLLMSDSFGSSSNCPSIRIFEYDEIEGSFVPTPHELPTSYQIPVRSITMKNSTFLFISNRNPCCFCTGNFSVVAKIDIYSWNEQEFEILHSLEVQEPLDMVVFKERSGICLVVLDIVYSKVYCSSETNPYFTEKEVLQTAHGQKAAIVQTSGRTFLAIVADPRFTYGEGQSFIDIYLWNSTKFAARKQQLQSISVQSVVLMNHELGGSEEVFLIIGEKSIPGIRNDPRILVYRFKGADRFFEKYQEIKDYGVLEWISLNTGELLFFSVDSQQGLIKVYQHKGVSGFVKIDTIKSLGVKKIRPFIRSDPKDSLNHYIALAGDSCSKQSTPDVYYAQILKSKLSGMRPVY